jgi:hypothetical protein
MRGNPRFPKGLPENLVSVPPRRRARFRPGTWTMVECPARTRSSSWDVRGRTSVVFSLPGPMRTLLSIETRGSHPPPVDATRRGAVRPSAFPRKVTILLRFRFDGEDQGWSSGRSHSGPGPEPDPAVLSREQQVEFLRLVHDGLGRLMACSQLKISERLLRRTLAKSSNFRRALEHVEQMRAENLFALLYAAALRGDTQAARFLLSRHDRERRDRG